eukprot:CAMPEP_0172693772 /NCGR_PEP_ID=MMETSP1074-20121228/26230_1 /TAXON_ID=2916 /ORGANISM="Ceratium fusus, Strain PA161109" /LENGTH=56 /DNA_ID=CAMNT_0013514195 /DNA_START=275 /DNA_END=445 /DNA_ORIENTATION=-
MAPIDNGMAVEETTYSTSVGEIPIHSTESANAAFEPRVHSDAGAVNTVVDLREEFP